MSKNGLPRACGPRNDTSSGAARHLSLKGKAGEEYHPCRWCTDKAVCHGECAKAAPYINEARRDFAEAMRRKEESNGAGSVQTVPGGA